MQASNEKTNIIRRHEQIMRWSESETDKASKSIKLAEKIKFSKDVQFLSACHSNDWPEIDRLLREGININCAQEDGLTSLHQACIDDDLPLVKYLIEYGANIDVQDKEGWTPLFAAVSCNYLLITKCLIGKGARLDILSTDGELPIDQSTKESTTSYLRDEMNKRNLDPLKIKNLERNTMLKDVETMKKTKRFSQYTMVDNGGTMLHIAASKDYIDVMEKLLETINSEQLNHTDSDGWNALHVAAYFGNRKACLLLINADIDFEKVTLKNETVLDLANDDVKPYIREEVRKAKFRRQEKPPIKRGPEPTGTEYRPSDTKIVCTDQKTAGHPQPQPQTNPDKHSDLAEGVMRQSSLDCNLKSALSTPGCEEVSDVLSTDLGPKSSIINASPKSETIPTNAAPIKVSESPESESNRLQKLTTTTTPSGKSAESESQRKDKARHNRSTRRSTQGLTSEDIIEAKKTISIGRGNSVQDSCNQVPNDVNYKEEKKPELVDTANAAPSSQRSEESVKTDTSDSACTVESNSIIGSRSESVDKEDIMGKTGIHSLDKRRIRNRPPTGIVELADIKLAQQKLMNSNELKKEAEPALVPEINYKAMYENELQDNRKLQIHLEKAAADLEQSEDKIKKLRNTHFDSNYQTNPPVARVSNVDEVEKLREENKKLKEANNALIRVISRLSHTPSKSFVISDR